MGIVTPLLYVAGRVPGICVTLFYGRDVPLAALWCRQNRLNVCQEDGVGQQGAIVFNLSSRRLSYGDQVVTLTPTQGRIMHALAAGKPVLLPAIISFVWHIDDEPGDPDRNVKTQVFRIKRQLKESNFPLRINVIWGRGYVLSEPISLISSYEPPILIPAQFRADFLAAMEATRDVAARERVFAGMRG